MKFLKKLKYFIESIKYKIKWSRTAELYYRYRSDRQIRALKKALELTETGAELRIEVIALRTRVREQAKNIANMQQALRDRNLALDAFHYVWCDGGCVGGVHQNDGLGPEAITQEIVYEAMINTRRLETWWANRQGRLAYEKDKK